MDQVFLKRNGVSKRYVIACSWFWFHLFCFFYYKWWIDRKLLNQLELFSPSLVPRTSHFFNINKAEHCLTCNQTELVRICKIKLTFMPYEKLFCQNIMCQLNDNTKLESSLHNILFTLHFHQWYANDLGLRLSNMWILHSLPAMYERLSRFPWSGLSIHLFNIIILPLAILDSGVRTHTSTFNNRNLPPGQPSGASCFLDVRCEVEAKTFLA